MDAFNLSNRSCIEIFLKHYNLLRNFFWSFLINHVIIPYHDGWRSCQKFPFLLVSDVVLLFIYSLHYCIWCILTQVFFKYYFFNKSSASCTIDSCVIIYLHNLTDHNLLTNIYQFSCCYYYSMYCKLKFNSDLNFSLNFVQFLMN